MKIKPLKDFHIYQVNDEGETNIRLEKGNEIEISEKFIANLITEGVISSKSTLETIKKGK